MDEFAASDVTAHWGVPCDMILPLGRGGYNNALYRAGDAHVLRVFQARNKPRQIQHELTVLWQLAHLQLPFAVPAPVLGRSGDWAAFIGPRKRLAMLMPLLPGENADPNNLAQCEAVGNALAHLRIALQKIDVGGATGPVGCLDLARIHPLVPVPDAAMRCLPPSIPARTKLRVNAVLDALTVHRLHLLRLPSHLAHADVIPGNILCLHNRVCAILDFENCAVNPAVFDLACAIDAWTFGTLETGAAWQRIRALTRGYTSVCALSQDEAAAIAPLMLQRNAAVLMHIIGQFLANAVPLVDVELWIDSLLTMDAWLKQNVAGLAAEILSAAPEERR